MSAPDGRLRIALRHPLAQVGVLAKEVLRSGIVLLRRVQQGRFGILTRGAFLSCPLGLVRVSERSRG